MREAAWPHSAPHNATLRGVSCGTAQAPAMHVSYGVGTCVLARLTSPMYEHGLRSQLRPAPAPVSLTFSHDYTHVVDCISRSHGSRSLRPAQIAQLHSACNSHQAPRRPLGTRPIFGASAPGTARHPSGRQAYLCQSAMTIPSETKRSTPGQLASRACDIRPWQRSRRGQLAPPRSPSRRPGLAERTPSI